MSGLFRISVIVGAATGLMLLVGYVGCGGGGGGGGGGENEDAIVYATATAENGKKAFLTWVEVDESDPYNMGFPVPISGADAAGVIDENYSCIYGGDWTVTGDLNETHEDVILTFDNCLSDSFDVNGTKRLIANGSDYLNTVSDVTITFLSTATNLRHSSSRLFTIYAGSNRQINFTPAYTLGDSNQSETITTSMEWDVNGSQKKVEDLQWKYTEDNSSSPVVKTRCIQNGKLYFDANLTARIDIDPTYDPECIDPFLFKDGALKSGSIRLLASNGTIDVNVTADNVITITGADGSIATITKEEL